MNETEKAKKVLARYMEAMQKGKVVTNDDKFDFRITDANRDQVLIEAKNSATRYAQARNKKLIPKSQTGAAPDSTIAWLAKRNRKAVH